MLVVADAAGRISFWLSHDRRVNVWNIAAQVDVPCAILSIGWDFHSTSLAAVLSNGSLEVMQVPEYPAKLVDYHQLDRRNQRSKCRDSNARRPTDPKYPANVIRFIPCANENVTDLLRGPLRCATVAPAYVDPTSVALITVNVEQPTRLSVWILEFSSDAYRVSQMSDAEMQPAETGSCVACAVVPKSGMLFALGDRGVIERWFLRAKKGSDAGWLRKVEARIDIETEDAVQRGIIPKSNIPLPTDATARGLEESRRRKVYAFEISSDSKCMLTSSSAGLLVWETEKLKVVAGYRVDHPVRPRTEDENQSPFWGLCVSPTGAALFALNGRGRVDAFSLLGPIMSPNPETPSPAALQVARRLLTIPRGDGVRGGWDILASIALEGPAAANVVARELSNGKLGVNPTVTVLPEKIALVKSLMLRIIHAEDASAAAAKKLLDLAIDAIKQSAPDVVKGKLVLGAKDAKAVTSPDNVSRMVRSAVASTRVLQSQLAAAPLADWIMVLSAVWLQRCATIVSKHDPKGQRMGTPWTTVVAMTARNEENVGPGHGMVYDSSLARSLRPASVAAIILLALEEDYGEGDAAPRYYRFPRDKAPCVVAALWEVSLAWESGDSMSRPVGGVPNATAQNAKKMESTAIVLARNLAAANTIADAKELRIGAAEKALGLHGALKGAGFLMSCVRTHQGIHGPGGYVDDPSVKNAVDFRAEWCQYDIVTGRPFPPWVPLRRCVVSGLLAAEITQPKWEMPHGVNIASPWIPKYANESPFGGRWARVPSLDLERFDLLPAVLHSGPERIDHTANGSVNLKVEDKLAANSAAIQAHVGGATAPHVPPQISSMTGVAAQQTQPGHGSAMVAALTGVQHQNGAAPQVMASGGNPMQQQAFSAVDRTSIVGGNAMLPPSRGSGGVPQVLSVPGTNPNAQRMQGGGAMSSTLSADGGSTNSRVGRKRSQAPGGSSQRRTVRKKQPTDRPTSTGPLDMAGGLPMGGSSGVLNVVAGLQRQSPAADAMSSDTRSTVTTNATGAVDQDATTKVRRTSKKRSTKLQQRQQPFQQVAQLQNPQQVGMPAFVPQQHVAFSQALQQGPAEPVMSKRQQQMMEKGQSQTSAAVAALAAQAVGDAGMKPQAMRNAAMLQNNLHNSGLGGMVMGNAADMASQLGLGANVGMGSAGMIGLGNNALGVSNGAQIANVRNANTGVGLSGVDETLGSSMQMNIVQGGGNMGVPNTMGNGISMSMLQGTNLGQMNAASVNMGALNGQGAVDPNLFQQSVSNDGTAVGDGVGIGGQPGAPGKSFTTLASNLGMNDQLCALSSAHTDALSRRARFQSLSVPDQVMTSVPMGMNRNTLNNGNMMVSARLNGVDMNGNVMGGITGGMMGAMVGGTSAAMSNMSATAAQGRGMVGGVGNGMLQMGMGAGMGGNVRVSGTDSVSSVPGRGSNGNVDNGGGLLYGSDRDGLKGGMGGGPGDVNGGVMRVDDNSGCGLSLDLGVSLGRVGDGVNVRAGGEGDGGSEVVDGGVGGVVGGGGGDVGFVGNNGRVGLDAGGSGQVGGGPEGGADRVWEGQVSLQGLENSLTVQSVAIRARFDSKAEIRDASGWPNLIEWNSRNIKPYGEVMRQANMPGAQWYVRFVPVDKNSKVEPKFSEILSSEIARDSACEVRINDSSNPGYLYLFVNSAPGPPSLLGVFKPDAPPPGHAPPDLPAEHHLDFPM